MDNYKEIIEKSSASEEIIDAINHLINQNEYDEKLIPIYVKYLTSNNRGLRDASYRILIHYPDNLKSKVADNVAPLIEPRDIEFRNLAGDILLKLGIYSVKPLIKYLKVDDFDIRKYACDIIGLVDDGKSIDTIIQLYDDNDINVVLSSIEAVGNIFFNNQTNVDKNHIIDSLIELFETNNEVVKPQIVETLGKIGGKESERFLLNVLRYESDFFIKIAAIDALAIVGSDIEICKMLMNELHSYPYDIQTVVLKTIMAISFRINDVPQLPTESRDIARRALADSDNDISSAGLIALGNSYLYDDTQNLSEYYDRADFETKQYILFNLLENSNDNVIQEFCSKIFKIYIKQAEISNIIDFISTIHSIWKNISSERKPIIITYLINLILQFELTNNNEMFELLSKFETNELNIAKELMIDTQPTMIQLINELFEKIDYLK